MTSRLQRARAFVACRLRSAWLSYTPQDAGEAALLAGITKSPGVYAPVAGDPRPRRRRNEILALMAGNGYIAESLAKRCQAEPVRVAARSPVKSSAPAAIENVFDELKQRGADRFGIEDLVQGRISVRSTLDERVQTIVNAPIAPWPPGSWRSHTSSIA